MKTINIYNFPKFMDAWDLPQYAGMSGGECMRALGFKSARYMGGNYWGLSDEDYTWFILRWS